MKKSDWSFLRIFFILVSLLILAVVVFVPESNIKNIVLGALIIIIPIVIDVQAPKIAKLSKENPKVKTLRTINRMVLSVLILVILYLQLKQNNVNISNRTSDIITVGALSLFMMIFGNLSPKIPFNRFVGLRLPWTVRDEDTWRLAHRLIGYISFPLAIIQFILILFINTEIIVPICVILWAAIPGLYSGWFYYRKFKKV